jgi:hypothetical protein
MERTAEEDGPREGSRLWRASNIQARMKVVWCWGRGVVTCQSFASGRFLLVCWDCRHAKEAGSQEGLGSMAHGQTRGRGRGQGRRRDGSWDDTEA